MFLQGILAAICPVLLHIEPHPDLHIQTPQRWWFLQQRMQRAGLLPNNWHCGIFFWASHCASPDHHGEFSLTVFKYFGKDYYHRVNTATIIGLFVYVCVFSHKLLVYSHSLYLEKCSVQCASRALWNWFMCFSHVTDTKTLKATKWQITLGTL